jgi:predicted ATP-grasp superfamily ATP-dependent carboligase
MATSDDVMILGASVRAAAFSALRAGLRPWCADLFADLDLRARCPAMRLPGEYYPEGFLSRVATDLPGPWIYTGGLENWPDLVRRMRRHRPLWGNGENEIRRARDPLLVSRALRMAGLPTPETDHVPHAGRWLRKPCHGSGGAGIRFWTAGRPGPGTRGPVYFQEYVEGDPCSALYVAERQYPALVLDPDPREWKVERVRDRHVWLLGVTRQLVGVPWLHAAPFRYCGSVGPEQPGEELRAQLVRQGRILSRVCGLRGLFGIDGVLRDGVFWPVEINPRYTASVEVLEYATGMTALAWHRRVFTDGLPGRSAPPFPAASRVGKAILFAREDLVFPDDGPWMDEIRKPTPLHEPPPFADIPAPGERIAAGRPVLTLLAHAGSDEACIDDLRRRAADLDRHLFGP